MAGAVEGEVVRGAHTRTSRSHTVRRAEASSICRRVSMTLCVSFRSKRAKVASSSWATEQAGGAWVSGCYGGTGGTGVRDEADKVRTKRRAASRAIGAAVITRGRVWREQGGPARLPCAQALCKGGKAGRSVFALKDLKNDSSSVVLPKPASPTTIKLNDSRGGSRERRGSMLRLWYGSRVGEPIERDLASRSRRYSSPITPVQGIAGDHRAHRIVAAS